VTPVVNGGPSGGRPVMLLEVMLPSILHSVLVTIIVLVLCCYIGDLHCSVVVPSLHIALLLLVE